MSLQASQLRSVKLRDAWADIRLDTVRADPRRRAGLLCVGMAPPPSHVMAIVVSYLLSPNDIADGRSPPSGQPIVTGAHPVA